MTTKELEEMFTYHAPNDAQIGKYQVIRNTAKSLAHVIIDNTPPCADQTVAIRKLRECVMTANAAIAIQGAAA